MSMSVTWVTCSWLTRVVCVHHIRFAIDHGDVDLISPAFASPIPWEWVVHAPEGGRGIRRGWRRDR